MWHQRLRHYSIERIKILVNNKLFNILDFTNFDTCVNCIMGKHTNKSKKYAKMCSDKLEIIHLDMDLYSYKYLISFFNDYSQYLCLNMLHNKNKTLYTFKGFKVELEKKYKSKKYAKTCSDMLEIIHSNICCSDIDIYG